MNYYNKLRSPFGIMNTMTSPQNSNGLLNGIIVFLIIIIVLLVAYCLYKSFEKFSVPTNKRELSGIFFVHRDGCGFSKRMHESLKGKDFKVDGHKVQIITLDSPLAKENNVNGTPTILKVSNGEVVAKSVGLKSIEDIEKELSNASNTSNGSNASNGSNGSNIIVLMSPTCPFCVRQVEELEKNNIPHEKILSNSEEGKALMQKGNFRGVPIILKNKNDITGALVGYNTVEQLKKNGLVH